MATPSEDVPATDETATTTATSLDGCAGATAPSAEANEVD